MIDTKWIGHRFPAIRWEVEKGRLRFFAKAIGETRPEFIDEDAAKAAGHPSLLAPPTILFSGPLDHDDVPKLLQMLGIDMNNRSEEHTRTPVTNAHLVCRLLLEKKK